MPEGFDGKKRGGYGPNDHLDDHAAGAGIKIGKKDKLHFINIMEASVKFNPIHSPVRRNKT